MLEKIYSAIPEELNKMKICNNKRFMNIGLFISCCLIVAYFPLYACVADPLPGKDKLVYGGVIITILVVILVFFSANGEHRPFVWNKWITVPYFCTFMGMMLISCLHYVGVMYSSMFVITIFVFPVLFAIWNMRGDYKTIFNYMAYAMFAFGIIYYIVLLAMAATGHLNMFGNRVLATTYSTYMLSMLGEMMFTGSLYLIFADVNTVLRSTIFSFGLGIGFSIVLLGGARTAIIACAVNYVLAIVFYCKKNGADDNKKNIVLKIAITIILLFALASLGSMLVSLQNNNGINNNNESVQVATDNSESIEEQTRIDRFAGGNGDINSYSSGRIQIWTGYCKNLNLLGHDMKKINMVQITNSPVTYAHNNILEYAFRFGVPIGLIYAILSIAALVTAIRRTFSEKFGREGLFSLLFIVSFGVSMMLEPVMIPGKASTYFLFFIALIPLLEKNNDTVVNSRIAGRI